MTTSRHAGMGCRFALAVALLLMTATVARADAALDALMTDYRGYYLAENPVAATRVGIDEFDDRLPRVTPQDQARRLETERGFLNRLRDIEGQPLDAGARVSAEVLAWVLADSIRAAELGLERIPFNTFSGFYMNALTASNGVRFDSAADYEDYLARLGDIPRYFAENIDNMRRGSEAGFVLPAIVIEGVLPTIEAQVKDDPASSSLYDPFRAMPDSIGDVDRARLERAGREVIAGAAMPAFERLAAFLRDEYSASESLGAEALPGGEEYYAFQVRRYTTLTDATSGSIHATGLAEVRRIRQQMESIIEAVGFDGDFEAFGRFLRESPQFYAETPEDLLEKAAWTAKRIDYVMPGFFATLPRQSYGIVPVPAEIAPNYTTGAYYGAPPGGSHGGAFWINTYALDQRPLYELPALTLHEAVPGHHHQNALALEMESLPDFRRDLYFSAFGEGWALYAEKLGVEMGIYRTPYEHFGRLSYEMWRACRLVIDTGIHAMGWSRQQAMDFLADNTSLSQANIRAEVDRYISWPGQALAYKLGELEIQALRRRAEAELGEDFDLREFHDVVLTNGALPLATLRSIVNQYIEGN